MFLPGNGRNMVETPFNYTGSKFKLLDQLIPLFDKNKTTFVDLFVGGGSVYTNVAPLYSKIVVNDIIGDLIGIHKKLIFEKEPTVDMVKSLCVAKDDQLGYHILRDSYNLEPTPEKLFALMLCCTNNMMRFNQKFKFNQTFGKRTFNSRTQLKIDGFSQALQPYKENIQFEAKSFESVTIDSNSMVYSDPPYLQTEAGYNSYWGKEDDLGLFDYCNNLNSIGASFAVSGVQSHDGRSCRLIDLLLEAGFHKTSIVCDYNKVSRKGTKETTEVLITNYIPNI
jgi:DNA adenine methylase Dam